MINISKRILTQSQIKLLIRGPKFCPMKKGNYLQIKADQQEFTRKLKLREKFYDNDYTNESLVKEPSKYTPLIFDPDVTKIIEQIEFLDPINTTPQDNLPHDERQSLTDLNRMEDIIIKVVDKGNTLIVMDTDYYRDILVLKQHLDTENYSIIEPNVDKTVYVQLNALMTKHRLCLTEKEFSYVTTNAWKSSNFYVLPKIHKCKSIIEQILTNNGTYLKMNTPSDLSGRPIIAGPASPTQRLSELLELILSPLVLQLKSFIKDDWDFTRKWPRNLDKNCDLYTCDVVSLYTSITHELGKKALSFYIDRYRHLIPSRFTKEFIMESATLILENNNFYFDGQMYHQWIGVAMGTIFAPPYACLSVGFLEETQLYPQLQRLLVPSYSEWVTDLFKRYIDDGIVPWPNELNIDIFKNILNNMDPHIKFTLEKAKKCNLEKGPGQQLNFLDIIVILYDSGILETDIYYKDTNTHDYLSYHSHHPDHIKNNIPFNLAKRIIVFCSDATVEKRRLKELKEWLQKCDYPEHIISKCFHNAKLQGPAPKPNNPHNTLPLVTTYSGNYDCSQMSKKCHQLLTTSHSERVKEVFGETRTVLALRQPPNILRQLSQAKFDSNTKYSEKDFGLLHCSSKKCILCRDYIQECKSFMTSNNAEFQIRCQITCNSQHVLYFLRCLCCNFKTTYTGRTCSFRKRMNCHISESRTGNTTNIFDKHVFKCKQTYSRGEPYFQILAFLVVQDAYQLPSYEKHFHALHYDTMNS